MSGPGGIGGGGSGLTGAGALGQIMALRQQVIDRSQLLRQVHEAPAGAPGETTGAPAGGGFAGALKNALDGVNASQQRAESIAEAYEKGQVTDVAQVMLARQEASVSFEATLQVRNKLLSAYQDIMRMGV
ncbi:MAG: flagellar hook-basal body complex protein FliE [Proteobacteria bacterium]|nr:flagellar hook-basal body complex protein FliE [Pseudomonadota bacterium]